MGGERVKLRDLEKLVTLLEQFKSVVPIHEKDVTHVQGLAENEVYETKRRGKKETPRNA